MNNLTVSSGRNRPATYEPEYKKIVEGSIRKICIIRQDLEQHVVNETHKDS